MTRIQQKEETIIQSVGSESFLKKITASFFFFSFLLI